MSTSKLEDHEPEDNVNVVGGNVNVSEDVGEDIDDKQVNIHNLEKSWEFREQIPDWLEKITKHLVTPTEFESLPQVAET
ncbi:1185_t:CDS:2 [Paraglomus brasilianum]|uniref:1185_t:CDS:1 n=1 Tax=Paraglomus brasilianum TaxID=144538 RepID=A0A9N9CY39_9GLOM|nr:1185_t:CDS:2 [Paraglomus brasilianum]